MRNLLPLFFLLISWPTIAQQYAFKRFSVEEGLPRSGVYSLLEDSGGFLWVATEGGGVAVFDGNSFQIYNSTNGLPNNTVRVLAEDSKGNIWMGTNGSGVVRFDGQKFISINEQTGLSNNYVRSVIEDDDGNIWAGTYGGGLNKISFAGDSISIEVFGSADELKSDIIRYAVKDSNGTVWFGTDGGLVAYTRGKFIHYGVEDGLPHKKVLVLFEDQQRNLWIGTSEGATRFDGTEFKTFTSEDGLISDRVRAFSQDRKGNIWIGTKKGVSMYNGEGFQTFTEANGLSNNRIRHIISDQDGDIWFGTYFGGICRFSGAAFVHFSQDDGLSNEQVEAVAVDGKTIWAGTHDGVIQVMDDDLDFEVHLDPLNRSLQDLTVNDIMIHPEHGRWFGTSDGLFHEKDGKAEPVKVNGFDFTEDVMVIQPQDDYVWIGSTEGISLLEKSGQDWTLAEYFSQPDLNEGQVSDVIIDKYGNAWIAFMSAGLMKFDGTEFLDVEIPSQLNGVASLEIGPFGFLWIGSREGGLAKWQLQSGIPKVSEFKVINIEHPELTTDVHQLTFDEDKNLWVGSSSGLQKLELNNRSEVKTIVNYGTEEGFVGTETSLNASAMDPHGDIWFGSIHGLTRYAPGKIIASDQEPRIHFTNVTLGEREVDWRISEFAAGATTRFSIPTDLELPYEENDITFKFRAIDLRNPTKLTYQWKLEGYTKDWSPITSETTRAFTNLGPGRYTFQVRAWNSSGIFNQQPAEFQFRVIAPFWMRWWFVLLVVLAIAGVVWLIIKQREKIYKERELELKQKVDDRTAQLRAERDRSDELLLNILPKETADELKTKGTATVQQHGTVSVLFTDFVGFTNITERISHNELIESLNRYFWAFDEIVERYSIEKIKTIGDAYMCAGGIPISNEINPIKVVLAGIEIVDAVIEVNKKNESLGTEEWQLRCGIHTGEVISGVVGKNKFAFDIWGDAVNTAARMESSGEVGKVNISGSTYEKVKDYFECTHRGQIKAKNKGEIDMYFVDRIKPEFSEDENGRRPNAELLKRLDLEPELTT